MVRRKLARDDAGDQEARDHKEDVDADEAAADRFGKGVIEHDRQHGDGTQAVDIRPIAL